MAKVIKILALSILILLAGCGRSGDISPWALRTPKLEPSRAVIQPGGHQKFIASLKDAAGNDISNASFQWSVSNINVADLEADPENPGEAFVMAASPGIVEVKVTSGGLSDTAVLTVDTSALRPVEISRVFPEEGSTISDPRPMIGLDMSYSRCACGEDALDTIRLFLGGVEVTDQATMSGTLDVPQSGVRITFLPTSFLSSGTHTVEANVTSKLERSSTYSWSFGVE